MPQVDITTYLPLILWILFLILVFLKSLVSNGTLNFFNILKLENNNIIKVTYRLQSIARNL